jgi:hypothetical protein
MASCSFNSGLPIACKDAMTGLKSLWIGNFENLISYTANTTNVVTGITMSSATFFYKFNLLKEAAGFTEPLDGTPQNGTNSYIPTLDLYLSKFSTTVRNQILLLARAKLAMIILDQNNQYWLLGPSNGMDLISGTGMIGKAYTGEQNGWIMQFTGNEPLISQEITPGIIAAITSA